MSDYEYNATIGIKFGDWTVSAVFFPLQFGILKVMIFSVILDLE